MGALTVPPAVLPQLLLHGIEHGRIHDRRRRHRDPVPRRRVRSATILPWLLTAATHRPQSRRPCFGARLAERGLAPVGGVPEQVPDRRALPYGLAMASRAFLPVQAPTHLSDAEPVTAHPAEDLADHLRLFLDDLEPCDPAAIPLADVAVAVRRGAEHVRRSRKRRMPLAAAAPLQDLGPLILRHHALHLQQRVTPGGGAARRVEEAALPPGALPLAPQQHLVGAARARATGGGTETRAPPPPRRKVAQLLERRPRQRGATVAV